MSNNVALGNGVFAFFYRIKISVDKFMQIRRHFNNWISIVMLRLGIAKNIVVGYDGKKITLKDKNDYYSLWDEMCINNVLEPNTTYFRLQMETMDSDYGKFSPDGEVVIDVGAQNGDSAIYFVSKGAKHVYAYELSPAWYKIAVNNIKRNKIGNKVTVKNVGVAGHERKIIMDEKAIYTDGLSRNAKKGVLINVTTLKGILESLKLENAFLKMDCEGCEYEAILNEKPEVLRRFKKIELEYHNGYVNIAEKLRLCGFRVSYTPALKGHSDSGEVLQQGLLYAELI